VGLLELAEALDFFIEGFDISTGLVKPYSTTMGTIYVHILVYLGVGIYLLSGAPHIVRLVFDRSTEKPSAEPNDPAESTGV
jgi:hypothetical protein